VSVVVPVTERPEELDALYREYSVPLREAAEDFEFLFVIQPWGRDLVPALDALREAGEPIRVLEVGQVVSESDLLKLAAERADAPLILTLPAYHRVESHGLLATLDEVRAGADMAIARRWPRRDSWVNRLQNRVFHSLVRHSVGGELRDLACGVRAMRREIFEVVPLYGDFFRFLPLLARREGFTVLEVDVPQHPADQQPRIYGPGVYIRRVLDVLGIFFLLRFTDKPLRFFGLLGGGLTLVGSVLLLVLFFQRMAGQPLADRPLLLLAVLFVVLGAQAVALGLIGEIIVHVNAPRRLPYRLESDQRDASTGD
jgi:hypothetical protein